MMARVLVTGSAGFIGSHLVEKLLDLGATVVGLDNFCDFYDPAVKERNIAPALARDGFELLRGDIRDADLVERAVKRSDVVMHLAAMAGVRPSFSSPALYNEVNVGGSLNILKACQRHGCKLVFASSSSVYGNSDRTPFSEEDPACHPISIYAATKRSSELLCWMYRESLGLDVVCLRLFTVYGPRQRPDLAIHAFSRCILNGQPIEVFGDGSMARDYTYVDDAVSGFIAAMHLQAHSREMIYNIGSDRPVLLSDLVQAIERAAGRKAEVIRRAVPVGDVRQTWADLTRSERDLGYRPRTTLVSGLQRFIEWLKAQMADGC